MKHLIKYKGVFVILHKERYFQSASIWHIIFSEVWERPWTTKLFLLEHQTKFLLNILDGGGITLIC